MLDVFLLRGSLGPQVGLIHQIDALASPDAELEQQDCFAKIDRRLLPVLQMVAGDLFTKFFDEVHTMRHDESCW